MKFKLIPVASVLAALSFLAMPDQAQAGFQFAGAFTGPSEALLPVEKAGYYGHGGRHSYGYGGYRGGYRGYRGGYRRSGYGGYRGYRGGYRRSGYGGYGRSYGYGGYGRSYGYGGYRNYSYCY